MLLRLLMLLVCVQLHATFAEEKCGTDEFVCANGNCLRMKWRCDGSSDCFDDSDEIGCPKTTCADNFFRCDDGQCIPVRWLCDQGPDCNDESDESPERCANKTCDGFRCQGNDQCIPSSWKCDGKKDCHKGDDEKDCSNPCLSTEFTCADKKCIESLWECDGHEDCTDGSDEIDCGGCEEGEFVCLNGQCINDQWSCDGDTDCKDGSDEENCTMKELMNRTCESNMFKCSTPLNEAKCIANGWKCDGDEDCPDGSDESEKECGVRTCASDERMCLESKYCVKKDFFCDHQEDCQDGSDERNCNYTVTPQPNCEPNQFDCNNDGSKCIFDIFKCDGNDDCGNFADEQNCPVQNVCKTNNGHCQHICVPTYSAPYRVCECNAGFELKDGSETACQDIDECKIRGTCSQICINRKGSYKCECEKDYVLTDHRYCKADSNQHVELILSDDYDIRRYELSTDHYTLLFDSSVRGAVAMDFDIRNQMVYWAGAHSEGVLSAHLQTGTVVPVLSKEVQTPDGLAVDWVHGNLYITDTGLDQIVVSRVDGSNSKVLVSGDMDEPRALVVDPYHGWMYWTDWGSDAKIEKCGMDGNERKAIVTQDVVWPNGLAIDYVDNRLYWVDAKLHHIGSTNLDGEDFRLILKGYKGLGHPFAITVFEDFIYWTDWIDNAVHKMSKFGTGNISTIAFNLKTPFDVRVFHIYRQPNNLDHCGPNYGDCSHLCLPSPTHLTGTKITKKYVCACPTGMVLEDSYTCINSSESTTPKVIKPTKPDDKEGNSNRPQKSSTSSPKKPVTQKPTEKPVTQKPTEKPVTQKPTEKSVTQKPTEKPVVTEKPVAEQTSEKSGAEVIIKYGETTEKSESNRLNGTEESDKKDEKSIGHVAGIAAAVICVVALVVGGLIFVIVRRYQKKNVQSMNFDNPVYRKTTTDDQLIMDKEASNSRLERESMQPLNQDEIV